MSNSFKENFAPSVVLVSICLVATLLLAATYQVTLPQIEAITKENADKARAEVLSTADDFAELSLDEGNAVGGVTEVYTATNGAGIVVTAVNKGFGGGVTVMTGINADGTVAGVTVTEHGETPGLGTKAMTESHLGQFVGQSAITNSDDGAGAFIDSVSGATYSSNAIFNSVNDALNQFTELGGVQ